METQEKTDNILFDENITQNEPITLTSPIIPNLQKVSTTSLTNYVALLAVLVMCFITLLWSRLNINETQTALSQAQKAYLEAVEEQERLELELHVLLSPQAIQDQTQKLGLTEKAKIIEIYEGSPHE